ncbi:MAG: metalloprotease TldD [Alphaproteobacteria bacterium]|nr:metalloprotease TldD [Alphaproteobacteria bacterium]
MDSAALARDLFFERAGLDPARVTRTLGQAFKGADDGELFLEYRQSESFSLDDGRIKSSSFDVAQGFGLRVVVGEATGYAHASELSQAALERATSSLAAVTRGASGTLAFGPSRTDRALYRPDNPLDSVALPAKIALLGEIDSYARAKDPKVRQVMASLSGEWQVVQIERPDGSRVADVRPLVRLNVTVVVERDGRMETGTFGVGGREGYGRWMQPDAWRSQVDEALRQALVNLDSVPAPAGEMTVVLGPGWPGILLHEAIGHGLEGDFNRKKTSAFAGLLGQRVASKGVTVIDDGTIEGRRGSLTIDDEGTPTGRTVLIEDGILRGYLQDRMNARLMGMEPTGNGRRQSFGHMPLPRMTNTYMLAGDASPEDIIRSVSKGLYAVNFGGGQVDITSGKFVFSAAEAYLIENGKVGAPVKGASLIGNGPDVLTKVSAIGSDMALDSGIGTCGKAGQGVPVGVGLPTLRVDGLTVGGTAA